MLSNLKFNSLMSYALEQAIEGFKNNEVPVGAIIFDNKTKKIIAKNYNQNLKLHDATAHAEILAIRQACLIKNSSKLDDCDLYVTLEPCSMCASAISLARIKRLYYGASDSKSGGVENGPRIFSSGSCHHKPEIYNGIREAEASELLREFFIQQRSKKKI